MCARHESRCICAHTYTQAYVYVPTQVSEINIYILISETTIWSNNSTVMGKTVHKFSSVIPNELQNFYAIYIFVD